MLSFFSGLRTTQPRHFRTSGLDNTENLACCTDRLNPSSLIFLEREKHRLVHVEDWRRWGSRGGRETPRRYGPGWFALLARRRWGRIGPEELEAARASK